METTSPDRDPEIVEERESRASIRAFAVPTFVGIVGAWLIGGLISCLYLSENAARFGESFGALNTLFSGLAFAGVILTVLMQRVELRLQRQELRLQRQELADTRAELKRQADAAESSERALERQRRAGLLGSSVSAHAALSQLMDYTVDLMSAARYPNERAADRVRAFEKLIREIDGELDAADQRTP